MMSRTRLLAIILAAFAARTGATAQSAEARTAARMESLRGDTAALVRFLREMPKGADLHNHISGAVYAENSLRWAAEDGLCFDLRTMTLVPPPCTADSTRRAASIVASDSTLRRRVVAAWSMQDWTPGGESGADHFFATFTKYSLTEYTRLGDMIAEVLTRAATDHLQYVELMANPEIGRIGRLALRLGWSDDLDLMRRRLDSAGLGDTIRGAVRHLDSAEAHARQLMRCGTPAPDPGCAVTARYIYAGARSRAPEQVFAQILAGFEWPAIDARYVGLNLVAPEHGEVALRDFDRHMAMIDHLRGAFPGVGITLHAGELSTQVTSRDNMRSHIRRSIETGHAQRIGHGVDVLQEDDADALLREMRDRNVLVEISLSSNDRILGVTGASHPLAAYLSHGVPVALATDDEGVSRSDMTHEYLRAVLDQHLDYAMLKTMARASITHAFADTATVRQLQTRLDAAYARFEAAGPGR